MNLELKDISFRYDKDFIFNHFNLKLDDGLSFIVGNNNSGKSTLLKIISGKLPYIGEIILNNKDYRRYKKSIFLDDFYIDSMKGKVKKYLLEIDDKLLEYFDVKEIVDKDFSDLSYSDKVRISVIKFISCDYDVLFIDNMLCWLSKNDKNKLLKKLKTIAKKKIIVVTSNNMEDLLFADRIILLNKGEVVLDCDREEFFSEKKELDKCGISLPFLVDLSYNLKLYDIIDEIYYDTRKLVDAIWK